MSNSKRNLRIGLIEGLLSTPYSLASIPGGFLLAALMTQWFSLDKSTFGWIVSLPSWANILPALALPPIARFITAKDLALRMAWLNAILWAVFVASLEFLPKEDGYAAAIFFALFFFSTSVTGAFQVVGWTAWVRDWVPQKLRGAYFGKRNSWISAMTFGFLLLVTAALHKFSDSLSPYVWILGSMVFLRFLGIVWMQNIHSGSKVKLEAQPLLKSLSECLAAPGLVYFILFSAWMNFWMSCTGPFTAVFTFEELNVAPSTFALMTAISTVTGFFGWTFWGRVADKAGAIPVIAMGTFLWELSNCLWPFLVPANSWLLYPMFFWGGFFSVSFFMGSFNLLLNLVPEKSSIAAISLHLAVTASAMAIAPILTGGLLEEFVSIKGGGIAVYHIGFAIKSAAFLLGLLILLRIREPGRTMRQSLPGAFRNVRQAMAVQGLELFANLTPFRSSSTPKK